MNNKDCILAVDNGTQSLKALVFDPVGSLIAKQIVYFTPPYVSPQPGWAEQDPDFFWDALCRACQEIRQSKEVDTNRLAGVVLTSQRGTVVNVDKKGKPLRPAMLWLDQRKTYNQVPVGGLWGALFKLTGLGKTVSYLQTEAETNWIRNFQPEIWDRTHKYLLLSGYLTYRLTGQFVDSIGCQVGYIPFDFKKLRWASRWNWKWQCLSVDPFMLPELHPPSAVLGHITSASSKETGIPEGLPVIAAAADKACEVIGSGGLDASIGCLSYGTTATINVTHHKYIEPIALLPAYPSAVPKHHTIEVQVFRGYWMVNWFKEEFGQPEQQEADRRGVEVETLFDDLIADIPPGSVGLMLQPYWTPGIKRPGPEAKGAIIGFGDIHTRAHIYRSILEGLAYALREGKELIEKKSGIAVTGLRVSGGGSQSENAVRLTADIFGLPTARPRLYETSGLGAAVNGAVGLGFYENFSSAVKEMTHLGRVFEPDMKNHDLYNELYHLVYRGMYKKLAPLYKQIRKIVGYPR